jgi:hypothetical protein
MENWKSMLSDISNKTNSHHVSMSTYSNENSTINKNTSHKNKR